MINLVFTFNEFLLINRNINVLILSKKNSILKLIKQDVYRIDVRELV